MHFELSIISCYIVIILNASCLLNQKQRTKRRRRKKCIHLICCSIGIIAYWSYILAYLASSSHFVFMDIYILQPLASAYGLARDRDGHWAWAIALGVSSSPRYQHAAVSSHSVFSPPYPAFNFFLFSFWMIDHFHMSFFPGFCTCTAPCIWRGTWWWPHGRRQIKSCRYLPLYNYRYTVKCFVTWSIGPYSFSIVTKISE